MYKASNIASPEMIERICTDVQLFLESGYNADNPEECITRGQIAEQYMAITGKMLADAKYHVQQIIRSEFYDAAKKAMEVNMKPAALNKYLKSLTADAEYLVTWCERLNRGCTHALDWQRTIVSKLKMEAAMAGKI